MSAALSRIEVGDLVDATVRIGSLVERYAGEVLAVGLGGNVRMTHPSSPLRGVWVLVADIHRVCPVEQRREAVSPTNGTEV